MNQQQKRFAQKEVQRIAGLKQAEIKVDYAEAKAYQEKEIARITKALCNSKLIKAKVVAAIKKETKTVSSTSNSYYRTVYPPSGFGFIDRIHLKNVIPDVKAKQSKEKYKQLRKKAEEVRRNRIDKLNDKMFNLQQKIMLGDSEEAMALIEAFTKETF